MLSRTEGRNYIILGPGEKIPSKINKKKTDKKLEKLQAALNTIRDELQDTYESDYRLYDLLQDEIFSRCECSYREMNSGSIGWIEDVIYSISELKENLSKDDEIPEKESITTLYDIGYQRTHLLSDACFWEKILENTEEKEVVEEIVYSDNPGEKDHGIKLTRRIRTTMWEKTKYGKASTSITYRKLRIGKKLAKVIENTRLKQPEW